MILRIFTIEIIPEFREEFEAKYKVVSLNLVKSNDGFISAEIGRNINDNTYVMVSKWENLAAIKKFAGASWNKAVIPAEMEKYAITYDIKHYNKEF